MLVWVACGGGVEAPQPTGDQLVLELGGEHRPLSAALRSAEVRLGLPAPVAANSDPAAAAPALGPESRPPSPPPPAQVRTVTLRDGETLWDVAREHLGAGHRWKILLELNGWTERQSRRLPVGTEVRLPPR